MTFLLETHYAIFFSATGSNGSEATLWSEYQSELV